MKVSPKVVAQYVALALGVLVFSFSHEAMAQHLSIKPWHEYPSRVTERVNDMAPVVPATRTLDVKLVLADDVRLMPGALERRISLAARVLGQCGIDLRATVPTTAPWSGLELDDSAMLERVAGRKHDDLTLYVVRTLVRKTETGGLVRPLGKAFYREGIEPDALIGSVWVSEFAFLDQHIAEAPRGPASQSTIAHEIVHLLCDCGHVDASTVDRTRGHLMVGGNASALASNWLDETMCDRLDAP